MPNGAPRWRMALALLMLAVLLHLALLTGVSRAGLAADANAPNAPPAASAMLVRTLPAPEAAPSPLPPEPAPSPLPPEPAATDTPAAVATATPAAKPPVQTPAAAAPAANPASAASAVHVPTPEPPASVATAASATEPPPLAQAAPDPPVAMAMATAATAVAATAPAAASPAVADTASGNDIPIYKTRFPPPLTGVYDLRRGLLSGTGTLHWRPAGARYEAKLEGRVAGLSVLTQVSQGGFDEAGIAPERFTDQRVGSAVRAANFQRERGLITFSGPSNEFSLLVGTQDRLSWMVQLAAIVTAEPQRLAAGGKIALYVVGARADASMWVFRSAGEETLETPLGPVRAVKFSREARGPYDTQADAWLDPSRHGLPVKARLGTGSGNDNEALELLLRELTPG